MSRVPVGRMSPKSTWVAVTETDIAGFSDLEPDGHVFHIVVPQTVIVRGESMTNYRMEKRTAGNQRAP